MIVMWHGVEFQKDPMKSGSNTTENNDKHRCKENTVVIENGDPGFMMDTSMKLSLFSSSERSKSTLRNTRKG